MSPFPKDESAKRYRDLIALLGAKFQKFAKSAHSPKSEHLQLIDLPLKAVRSLGMELGTCARHSPFCPWLFALDGDLGAGKTTLIKAVAAALGFEENQVQSPTFSYLLTLPGRVPLHHFDLYRMRNQADFEHLGFDEILEIAGVCCIEWAERIALSSSLHRDHLHLHLQFGRRKNLRSARILLEQRKLD